MRALARVHAMDVPVKKTTNWVFDFFDGHYHKFLNNESAVRMVKELNCQAMLNNDIKADIDWMKRSFIEINSPVVFTHIDFRGSNIMVTEPDDQIVLCDFEYSSYGYRGYDFGTIIGEWGRSMEDMMKSERECQSFPSDATIKELLKPYISESEKIFGKKWSNDSVNSVNHLVSEVKLFTLAAYMFIIVFCLASDEQDNEIPIDKKIMMVSLHLGFLMIFNILIVSSQTIQN